MQIDLWTILALVLIVPAVLFLLGATLISAARLSDRDARIYLVAGVIALPIALACAWVQQQDAAPQPWAFSIEYMGFIAGFAVLYALAILVTRAIRSLRSAQQP